MLSGPVALLGFKSLKSSSSSIKVHPLETRVLTNLTMKVQVISSTISFTFNVIYLPSVFQIISAKLLIRYICDFPIHHKENKQAELTRPS